MANTENGVPRPAEAEPAQTLRTEGGLSVVEMQRNGRGRAIEDPVHTVRAEGQHHALVYANRANNQLRDAETDPSHVVLTGGTQAVVMRNNDSRGDNGQMVTPGHEPIRTLTTAGHQSILIPYDRTGRPRPASSEATPTLTQRDRVALLVPAGGSWADASTLEHEPVPTQTAREVRGVVFTDDDIDECLFRMFALHEIAGAMVMADHVDGNAYQVLGNKREQMAQYGNAVTPPAARELIGRLLEVLS